VFINALHIMIITIYVTEHVTIRYHFIRRMRAPESVNIQNILSKQCLQGDISLLQEIQEQVMQSVARDLKA
jgi:hypothetical protein